MAWLFYTHSDDPFVFSDTDDPSPCVFPCVFFLMSSDKAASDLFDKTLCIHNCEALPACNSTASALFFSIFVTICVAIAPLLMYNLL